MPTAEPLSAHVVAVLRELIDERGMTPYRVIKVTGMKPQRVYRWLRGEYEIPLEDLKIVATIFDVSAASLLAEAEARFDAEVAADDSPLPVIDPEVQAARDEWDRDLAARRGDAPRG